MLLAIRSVVEVVVNYRRLLRDVVRGSVVLVGSEARLALSQVFVASRPVGVAAVVDKRVRCLGLNSTIKILIRTVL